MLPRPGGSRKTTPLSPSGEIEILFAFFFFHSISCHLPESQVKVAAS